MEKQQVTNPIQSKKILKKLRDLPDERGLLKRIFVERTFPLGEILDVLHNEHIETDNPGNYVFFTSNPNDKPYVEGTELVIDTLGPEVERRLTPPMLYKFEPGYFEFRSTKNGDAFRIHQQGDRNTLKWKWGERPKGQNIIKTRLHWEANELVGAGYEVIGVEDKEVFRSSDESISSIPWGGRETWTEYTLVRNR